MMPTITINLDVDPKTAKAYLEASEEDRGKVGLILGLRLQLHFFDKNLRSFFEVIDEISRQAQASGLTPEILQEILDDEE